MKKIISILFLCSIILSNCDDNKLGKRKINALKPSVEEFVSGNKKVQKLWYEDRMDEMGLVSNSREKYKIIVKYFSLKMESLREKKLNNAELKREFPKLIRKLRKDVSNYLTTEQIKIHDDSWEIISTAIYKREGL
ncbi:hypothetical protein [uncultured Tenacibaculum sp.]|uniref:hypothetical protein n=1 Tax=uncultured Tenacibaculum sp. TaxID=174713 RepID=UPI00262EAD7A|nr:hypothetical protein [uncultured Tenacibaculum sp.]